MEKTLNNANKQKNNRKRETCHGKDTKKRKAAFSRIKHGNQRIDAISNPSSDLIKNYKNSRKNVIYKIISFPN